MQLSHTSTIVRVFLAVCCGTALSFGATFAQSPQSVQTPNPFEAYFKAPATPQGGGGSEGEATYTKLIESTATMTPAEIATAISVIDRQLDNTTKPQDQMAKAQAVSFLQYIAWRPDGPELLASQMERLASMLNEPSHSLSAPALMTLREIGYRRPDLARPILEAGLKAPDVNNATGIGPAIAYMVLHMGPYGDDVPERVVEYMHRPDLTETQLLGTIVRIDSGPIPDPLAAELVRSLDRPNERIKLRALVGLSQSSPSAKDAARARIQRMANDPTETARVRRIAAEALEGVITENPESAK